MFSYFYGVNVLCLVSVIPTTLELEEMAFQRPIIFSMSFLNESCRLNFLTFVSTEEVGESSEHQ